MQRDEFLGAHILTFMQKGKKLLCKEMPDLITLNLSLVEIIINKSLSVAFKCTLWC